MNTLAAQAGRNARFSIRSTEQEKKLVSRAAELAHMTTSQFVLQAAMRSAEELIADQSRFTLPPAEWDAFVAALDRPAREIPALKTAAEKPSPFSDR